MLRVVIRVRHKVKAIEKDYSWLSAFNRFQSHGVKVHVSLHVTNRNLPTIYKQYLGSLLSIMTQ